MSVVYLGLESGGTKLCASLCDERERQLGFVACRRPPNASALETLAELERLGEEAFRRYGPPNSSLAAVGWGFGGPVDREANRPLINFHESGWETVDATQRLSKRLTAPVFVENDCKVAGLAEAWQGAGVNRGLMVYLTLGSGLGGGLVLDGEILAFGRYGEMEVGHIELVRNGARCACGRRGCAEAYCSGWGLGERAGEAAGTYLERSPLAREILDCAASDRARLVLQGWPEDVFAKVVVGDFLSNLSRLCADLVLMLAPQCIVLGGGVARTPWLVDELLKALTDRLSQRAMAGTVFRTAKLEESAVSLGAAMFARRRSRGPAVD